MFRFLPLVFSLISPLLWGQLSIPSQHELDQRSYRRFVMDNQLKVLLVHDPDLNQSSAGMDVGVGSLSDPKHTQGLAHFLEHMLFLGTQKYPEEGEFGRFLRSRAGYFNAFTAGNHTNYHFQIHHDALEGAIDRFSQFFISPLFSPEFSNREILAVHNEHKKNVLDDGWRQYHLLNTFFDPEHPARHFSTGNEETLKHVEPSILKSFYEQHYSANNMALVIMSPKSLDWMEDIAKKSFSAIIDRKIKRNRYPEQYLATAETFRYIEVKPVKDLRELNLHFPLPSLDEHILSQPGGLLGYIIGHEGEGSLLSALKKENLATGLSAGAHAATPNYGSFNIHISLTPEGRKNTLRVTELCFAAIKTIQAEGLPQHIFDEVKTKQNLEKVFSHRGEGSSRASELATNLNRYPMELAETLRFCLSEKNDDSFIALAKKLTPNNCLAMLSAKDVDTDRIEPIYGTAFSYREDKLWYEKLKKVTTDANIHLPSPNPFFPQSAEVLPEQPALVIDEPGLQLYYLQDRDFLRPKASLLFRLKPSDFSTDLKTSVSIDVAIACIKEQLNEILYPASLAGADLSLSRDEKGFLIQLSGYDQSLEKLLNECVRQMSSLSISQKKFDATLDRMIRNWENFSKESAYQQARIIARSLRRKVVHTPQSKAKVAKGLRRNDIAMTINSMWSHLHTEALAYGNIKLNNVIKLTKSLREGLNIEGIKDDQAFKISTLTWPEAEQFIHRDELDTNNACFRLDVWLGQDSSELRAASRVLNNFISQPFYVEMRTRQQLGYIVASATYRDGNDHYLVFIIQSGTHNAKQLTERCRKYLPELSEVLENLPQSEFLALKQAIKKKLDEKHKRIASKASSLFQLAYEEKGNFGLKQQITAALNRLTKQDLLALLKRSLSPKTEKSLTLELFAKGPAPELLEGGIKNIEVFKQSRSYQSTQ